MTNIILGLCVHAATVMIFYLLAYVVCVYVQGWDLLFGLIAGLCAMGTGSIVNVVLNIDRV